VFNVFYFVLDLSTAALGDEEIGAKMSYYRLSGRVIVGIARGWAAGFVSRSEKIFHFLPNG
jgi:hypothetical protein